jgi:hypothetical protein
MAGLGETLGSLWPPLAIHPWFVRGGSEFSLRLSYLISVVLISVFLILDSESV